MKDFVILRRNVNCADIFETFSLRLLGTDVPMEIVLLIYISVFQHRKKRQFCTTGDIFGFWYVESVGIGYIFSNKLITDLE